MTGYLVALTNGGGYLERVPYDGRYSFLAGSPEHATVFSKPVAEAMALVFTARGKSVRIVPDSYFKREPEIAQVPAEYRQTHEDVDDPLSEDERDTLELKG